MRIMAVYATVGHKPVHMEGAAMLLYIFTCRKKRRVLKEIPILDCLCNLGKILIYDTTCAHVQMSHLGISHLPVRKPDCKAAGISFYERALGHQLVHDRSLALQNGISFCLLIQPITIQNHQHCWFLVHHASILLCSSFSFIYQAENLRK